jgi:transketolase
MANAHDIPTLEATARRVRGHVVAMSHRAGAAHLGSALSCVDILVAAYFGAMRIDASQPDDPNRDRLILSKGHAASALYATLAERGFFPLKWLESYGAHGSRLAEQPAPRCAPGIEAATGSLGHGLPLGLGIALAGRIHKRDYRVLVVVSDGECNEGSMWEAAMFAPAQKLAHLTVIVDYNRWQATGRSDEIMALDPLARKWESFGWRALEVDGHDIGALANAMNATPLPESDDFGKPLAIIAHTTKGKGVSFMEDDNNWHYRAPNAQELEQARQELELTGS